jgi:hypothetical protein
MPLPVDTLGGPAQLTWYIGQDDCLYAHELQTDCLFKIVEDISTLVPPPVDAGVPEAPTDGQLYGRESAAWAVVPSTPPSDGVQKTGDTMTGTLVMKNDQFTADTNGGTPVAAVVIEDNAGAEATGLALAPFGDLTITGPRKGLQIHSPGFLQMYASDGTRTAFLDSSGNLGFPPASALVMSGDATSGDLIIQSNTPGNGIKLASGGSASSLRLHLAADDSGDLIVTSTNGPNAGKSVNLTYGKWI